MVGNLAMQHQKNYEDFLALENDDRHYYEFDNGVIIAQAAPSLRHQLISKKLTIALDGYFSKKKCTLLQEVDCNFNEDNSLILRPDISVVCNPNQLGENQIIGSPTLVIEILSPSTKSRDVFEKKRYYQEVGVKEYWIIDPESKTIEVIQFIDSTEELSSTSIVYLKELKSVVFNDLKFDIATLFD